MQITHSSLPTTKGPANWFTADDSGSPVTRGRTSPTRSMDSNPSDALLQTERIVLGAEPEWPSPGSKRETRPAPKNGSGCRQLPLRDRSENLSRGMVGPIMGVIGTRFINGREVRHSPEDPPCGSRMPIVRDASSTRARAALLPLPVEP